ncbi:GEVED domain-containing protein [Winogradskyella sp.]|uniref:GEVED domain-containing protein n=1 Tax=Winogradskyella sp. TaxID=1883156 RepID=UPI003F6A7AD1
MNATNIVSSSVTLNWSTTAGATFDLRYREVGSGTWIVINDIDTTTYDLTGLNPETDYEYEVRSLCGTNSSVYSTTDNFSTAVVSYCNAQGNNISDEYISRVEIDGVINDTESSTSSGYSNFKGMSIFNSMALNSSNHNISVTKFWTGTNYNEAVSVWIDFDQDGIFSAAEKILESGSSTIQTVSNPNFSIPVDAKTGDTVMRVIMKYYGNPTGQIQNDPCETFTYGEVEDYTVNIFDETLSVNTQDLESIAVYPNPFKDTIDIKIPSGMTNNDISYNVNNVLSRSIASNNVQLNDNTIRILNNVQSGTYFLGIQDQNTNQSVVK